MENSSCHVCDKKLLEKHVFYTCRFCLEKYCEKCFDYMQSEEVCNECIETQEYCGGCGMVDCICGSDKE